MFVNYSESGFIWRVQGTTFEVKRDIQLTVTLTTEKKETQLKTGESLFHVFMFCK